MSRLLRLAAPLLAAIALVGYLAGHRNAPSAPADAASSKRIAYGASVMLEYPAGWRPTDTATAPAIPGLPITHAILLAPGGNGSRAGLLSGLLASQGPSPLPSQSLAQLHGVPHTEVVDLLDAQAYRYSRLEFRDYHRTLYLYVIPDPGGKDVVLACYAAKSLTSSLRQCEEIVAGLTLVGRSPSNLTPEASYARSLNHLVGELDDERLKLRGKMRAHATPTALGHFAEALANRFAAAAGSLAILEPPLPAGAGQAALANAIVKARHAYETLASAALGSHSREYAIAQARIEAAEAGVDKALENFNLLGYSPE